MIENVFFNHFSLRDIGPSNLNIPSVASFLVIAEATLNDVIRLHKGDKNHYGQSNLEDNMPIITVSTVFADGRSGKVLTSWISGATCAYIYLNPSMDK